MANYAQLCYLRPENVTSPQWGKGSLSLPCGSTGLIYAIPVKSSDRYKWSLRPAPHRACADAPLPACFTPSWWSLQRPTNDRFGLFSLDGAGELMMSGSARRPDDALFNPPISTLINRALFDTTRAPCGLMWHLCYAPRNFALWRDTKMTAFARRCRHTRRWYGCQGNGERQREYYTMGRGRS